MINNFRNSNVILMPSIMTTSFEPFLSLKWLQISLDSKEIDSLPALHF